MDSKDFHHLITPYDLLRYIIPGAVLLFCIFLFELWTKELSPTYILPTHHKPLLTSFILIKNSIQIKGGAQSSNWAFYSLFFVIVIISAYVIGHFISTLSSFFIDRILIGKGWKYPYIHLLNSLKDDSKFPSFWFYLFIWINCFLFVIYIMPAINIIFGKIVNTAFVIELTVKIFIFLFYLIIILLCVFKKPNLPKFINKFMEFIGLITKMEDQFINKFKTHFKNNFKYDCENADTNTFWLPYLLIKSQSGVLGESATSWRRLCAFIRNLSTAFYLAFLYSFSWLGWMWYKDQILQWKEYKIYVLIIIPFLFFLAFFIFLWRYIYLHVFYLTKLVLRSFFCLCENNNQKTDNQKKEEAWKLAINLLTNTVQK